MFAVFLFTVVNISGRTVLRRVSSLNLSSNIGRNFIGACGERKKEKKNFRADKDVPPARAVCLHPRLGPPPLRRIRRGRKRCSSDRASFWLWRNMSGIEDYLRNCPGNTDSLRQWATASPPFCAAFHVAAGERDGKFRGLE